MKNELVLQVVKETEILGKKIVMYGTINNPLFIAKDVAEWIEDRDGYTLARKVDSDEKLIHTICVSGQNRETTMLTEDGLYEACFNSRKPIAKQMKKEIKKYLKTIRLTGGAVEINREQEFINNYFSSFSDETKKLMVVDLQKKNEELQSEINQLKPDADMANDIIKTKGWLTLKQVADLIEIGRTTLCSLLREKKILSKQTGYNEPMHQYIKSDYFSTVVSENEKTGHVSVVTLVSPKGLKFIYRLIKKNELLDEFNTTPLQEVQA